jgi:endonuclease YncB( thermonuclease family)
MIARALLVLSLLVAETACARPLHKSPLQLARETPFIAITVHDCYDGDTCTVTLSDPFLPPVLAERIPVRLAGIDTPELRGECAEEIRLARLARNLLQSRLAQAVRVDLVAPERDKYFRLLGYLIIDGRNINAEILAVGLARPYAGGTKSRWC